MKHQPALDLRLGRSPVPLGRGGCQSLTLTGLTQKKPAFYSKSLFLTHKYLRETGFLGLPA